MIVPCSFIYPIKQVDAAEIQCGRSAPRFEWSSARKHSKEYHNKFEWASR